MNLNSLIIESLSDLNVPVAFLNYTGDKKTYIRFFEYDQGAELSADNEELYTGHYIQVDVFSPSNYFEIVEGVKRNLKNVGFKKNFETELYEDDTKLYHKVLRFYFISETEED